MIRNIILDMGNVLLDYNPEVPLKLFCKSEEAKDMIRRELFGGPEWIMGDRGEIRDRDRYELVKKRIPAVYHEELRKCVYGWEVCMEPLPGAREFCTYARDKGYGVYVLSNASDLFYEYFPRFLPLSFFDGVLVSCDVHVIKPDVRIYELLLAKYGLNAGECLFIDDRAENVEGAKLAGLQGIPFTGDFGEVYRLLEQATE